MTTEQAIDLLDNLIGFVEDSQNNDYDTALKMAIEALSCSEPKTAESGSVDSEMPEIKSNRTTGGMIYRQDAIDALRHAQHRFTVADEAGGMGTVKWSEDVIYFAAAERVLADLPSAQPVFSELCATELTCEGCGDMYEEREGNG